MALISILLEMQPTIKKYLSLLYFIIQIFETKLNFHAPIRKRNVHTEQTPRLNPSIRALMRERDKTKQLALKDGSLWSKYKKLRNRVTRAMREAVKDYYAKQIIENQHNPTQPIQNVANHKRSFGENN